MQFLNPHLSPKPASRCSMPGSAMRLTTSRTIRARWRWRQSMPSVHPNVRMVLMGPWIPPGTPRGFVFYTSYESAGARAGRRPTLRSTLSGRACTDRCACGYRDADSAAEAVPSPRASSRRRRWHLGRDATTAGKPFCAGQAVAAHAAKHLIVVVRPRGRAFASRPSRSVLAQPLVAAALRTSSSEREAAGGDRAKTRLYPSAA